MLSILPRGYYIQQQRYYYPVIEDKLFKLYSYSTILCLNVTDKPTTKLLHGLLLVIFTMDFKSDFIHNYQTFNVKK